VRVASPTQHYCPFDSLALFAALPSSTGVEPVHSLRKGLFPHHLSSHLLREPLRPVRDRASQHLMQPSSSRGPAMSRACPRPGLHKLVTSWVLKPGSTGRPLVPWGSTRENFSSAVVTAPHQRAHQVSRPRQARPAHNFGCFEDRKLDPGNQCSVEEGPFSKRAPDRAALKDRHASSARTLRTGVLPLRVETAPP